MKEIVSKATTLCILLIGCTSIALAQTNNSYIDTQRSIGTIGLTPDGRGGVQAEEIDPMGLKERTHLSNSQRMGWNSTSIGWQRTAIDQANELSKQGENSLREGNLFAAQTDFQDALAIDATWANAYIGLAKVFTIQGKSQELSKFTVKCFMTYPYGVLMVQKKKSIGRRFIKTQYRVNLRPTDCITPFC